MATEAIPQKEKSSFIARTWLWLRTLDDAVHYDPVDKLQHRIDRLERRFAEIDGNSQPEKEQE